MSERHKDGCYKVLEAADSGKITFKCDICGRSLSSKQRVLIHLSQVHNLSPVKRSRKKYLDDPCIPVPKRTLYWRKKHNRDKIVKSKSALHFDSDLTTAPQVNPDPETNLAVADQPLAVESIANQPSYLPIIDLQESQCAENGCSEETSFTSFNDVSSLSDDDCSLSEVACTSTDSDDSGSDSSDCFSDNLVENSDEQEDTCTNSDVSTSELQSLCILAFATRHKLTGAAGNDLIQLLKALSPTNSDLQNVSYKTLLESISNCKHKCMHYCQTCSDVFPTDESIFRCATPGCVGFRYEGGEGMQQNEKRKPRCSFVIADVKSQFKKLLQKPGIWNNITRTKASVLDSMPQYNERRKEHVIRDIVDGECYRNLCQTGQFLSQRYAFSGIFNTDGVPLYSSTKVKLWPIFIAINEISPSVRFARENLILAGIWQGKSNPPFFQYMSCFGEELLEMYNEGIEVNGILVKFGVYLGTLDLQAKGYVVNMTMHNGVNGCITCEDPGQTVKQGKGTARQYPYRNKDHRFKIRSSDDIKEASLDATKKSRVLGICGPSGLMAMPWFDLVWGIVPDYMHGVLLGVTKTLLMKMLSPTNAGKGYFVGKHLKDIAKRLSGIKPPDCMDRVPRDLVKHYQNLKASELQAWLLHYSLPCLNGYLPEIYLQNLAKLSEGIYILLSDNIQMVDLEKAGTLLEEFYSEFATLYGEGSCGLNVHNIGIHLTWYVRRWGPLFGWSCFGFEDGNADILSSTHGTKDVTGQILTMKEAQMTMNCVDLSMSSSSADIFLEKMNKKFSKRWISSKAVKNCQIAGATKEIADINNISIDVFLNACAARTKEELLEVHRVQIGEEKFYCKRYKKMVKKICYIVLFNDGTMMSIEFFVLNTRTGEVFAFGYGLDLSPTCFLFSNGGHHIMQVEHSDAYVLQPVHKICEKLVYMKVDGLSYITRVPNRFGHGVLK